ncbi:MAG: 1-acyl-sn-glycerol-3-phosphate acyltransferase [Coriobacteriales bacterium]|nr:1-acyl-sn-glycerol-3-phosphate acyltransferase [Coriobacteriales bacterium]
MADPEFEKLRYPLIYRIGHRICPLLLRGYSFQTDVAPADLAGPYIVMANHLTEVDMFMLVSAFPQHMYFVAGEHLMRNTHGRRIIWAQNPILEFKGSVAVATVREIIGRVKAGHNVMIFPEGSRSFNGETPELPASTGQLVKMAGCGLVTYRIEGGYFCAPRWAYTVRKGPMKGHIVNIYTKEQVAAMSKQELTALINRDIHENAYETQRRDPHEYRGERLAEGLENYLIKCSACGALDSMETHDDHFRCKACGQEGIYTPQGFLQGEGLRFDSVYDWGVWSESEIVQQVRAAADGSVVFTDSDVTLYEISASHERTDLAVGELRGFRDRLELGGEVFAFKDIPAMDMLYFGKTLLFSHKGRHLGITGESFHALKYHKLYVVAKEPSRS